MYKSVAGETVLSFFTETPIRDFGTLAVTKSSMRRVAFPQEASGVAWTDQLLYHCS